MTRGPCWSLRCPSPPPASSRVSSARASPPSRRRSAPGRRSEQLLLLAAVVGALVLLVGGVLGDTDGRRRIHDRRLGVLVITGLSGLFFTDGPLFLAGRLVGAICGVDHPAVRPGRRRASPTRASRGRPRSGLAYAAYGAGDGRRAGPPDAVRTDRTALAGLRGRDRRGALIAFVDGRRHWPDLPTPSRRQRRRVVATAVWAAGIIVTCIGLVGFGHGVIDALRIGLFVGGLAVIARLAAALERGVTHDDDVHVERRPVAMALFVGFVIAFAQSATLLQVPLFFQLISGYGPLVAVVATLPFIIALIVTGPVVGVLLGRVGPRPLITSGSSPSDSATSSSPSSCAPRASYLVLHPPFALHRRRVRHRHDGPDRDHLRERAARAARDGRGPQRGIRRDGDAGRSRGRHAARSRRCAVSNLTAALAGQPPGDDRRGGRRPARRSSSRSAVPATARSSRGSAQPERVEFGRRLHRCRAERSS